MDFLRRWQWPLIMVALAWPAALLRLHVVSAGHAVETVLFGLAIVSAAFLLTWVAEAAERDVPRTLALAGLALIAVLPEYAVDMLFAWKAGNDPSYAAYATANMTGGNRLLVGIGWSMVVAIFVFRTRGRVLKLAQVHRNEVGILGIATVYSFIIPLRGGITLFDAAFLVSLFGVYVYLASKGEVEEGRKKSICGKFGKNPLMSPFQGRRLDEIIAYLRQKVQNGFHPHEGDELEVVVGPLQCQDIPLLFQRQGRQLRRRLPGADHDRADHQVSQDS